MRVVNSGLSYRAHLRKHIAMQLTLHRASWILFSVFVCPEDAEQNTAQHHVLLSTLSAGYIAFMHTAQGLALHGFISFRMRQEIHRPSGCLEIIVQVCLFALQFETATGSACATLASVCRVVQISHDRRLKNQWVSLASSLDEQLDGKGQEVPTLKFMIHQSALSNALEKCNP